MINDDTKKFINDWLKSQYDTHLNDDVFQWLQELSKQNIWVGIDVIAGVCRFSNWMKSKKTLTIKK